ncbi:MAG: hypothetical protein KF756_01260 [Acidobacteria bacterium]|nr:hypothetical protein [Acidobacteriota bacterium]
MTEVDIGSPRVKIHSRMNQGFTVIHFKAESGHGLTYANGIAKFSRAGIILEFESKFLGLFSNGVKEVRVSFADIHLIKFKQGFLFVAPKIILRLNSIAQASQLPNDSGKIVLKIAREDADRAREAVAKLENDKAELEAALPPPQASVSELFLDEVSEKDTKKLAE